MVYDIAVGRDRMLGETFGMLMLHNENGTNLVFARQGTDTFDATFLRQAQGKTILLVGAYFKHELPAVIKVAKHVTVFYNTSDVAADEKDAGGSYTAVQATPDTGFATWVCNQLKVEDKSYLREMAERIDRYLYGFPSDDDCCFQNGVYVSAGATDLEKLALIRNSDDIVRTIAAGRQKRLANLAIAQARLKTATKLEIPYGDKTYTALAASGDSPIVDSCIVLADHSPSGIGLLVRHDYVARKTLLSMRVTSASKLDAGAIMRDLFGGGGSMPMGGATIECVANIPNEPFNVETVVRNAQRKGAVDAAFLRRILAPAAPQNK